MEANACLTIAEYSAYWSSVLVPGLAAGLSLTGAAVYFLYRLVEAVKTHQADADKVSEDFR
jgi:hypothetical protein